jgi:hypothetical protein
MNARRWLSRWLAGAGLAGMLTVTAVVAQNRETLETDVSVNGNEVIFKWSKKHPWDAELIARGASLYAEYRTARSAGVECLQQPGNASPQFPGRRGAGAGNCFTGNSVLRGDDRTIRFQLPETLTAEPTGPVCLLLRLPDQRVLPIRRANKLGGDTARFEIPEWSRAVTARLRRTSLENRRAELRAAIATQTTEITEQEQSNRGKGWVSAESCSGQSGGTVEIARSGRPVAPPDQQDAIARQVCVIRAQNGLQYTRGVQPPTTVQNFLALVDPAVRDNWLKLRGQQLSEWIDDWERFGNTIPSYKAQNKALPHFGTYENWIPIQSLAGESYQRIRAALEAKTPIDQKDVLGYYGATVEAYGRCVRDGKNQLDLNYREAAALQTAVQQLPERLQQQAVQACQAGIARVVSMRTRVTTFEQELATVERDLGQLNVSSAQIKSRDLNDVSCVP